MVNKKPACFFIHGATLYSSDWNNRTYMMELMCSIWKCMAALVLWVRLHPKQLPTIHCQVPKYLVSNSFFNEVATSFCRELVQGHVDEA